MAERIRIHNPAYNQKSCVYYPVMIVGAGASGKYSALDTAVWNGKDDFLT